MDTAAGASPDAAPAGSSGVVTCPDDGEVLRALVDGTAGAVGDAFFETLVVSMARAMGVSNAFVAEFAGGNHRVRTLAYCRDGALAPNIEFDLAGTPCQDVVAGRLCHHPRGVRQDFPGDRPLVEMGIESYLGVPLQDKAGTVLGHLAVFDPRPMPAEPRQVAAFQVFAARAAAELQRLRMEQRAAEDAQRLADLFDEAPIAYVHEDLDSRFLRANRAAMRILGITPEEVSTTYGKSLVPDTPEAQRRVREAFESIGRGTDTAGVVLELRRRDNGKPIWIQWWSRPDPSGAYTRTMFIDITDRVLMEQEQARLQAQNLYLRDEIKTQYNFDEIVGSSPALKRVFSQVRQVAPTDSTVLIVGETGTGKELLARAIHGASRRKAKPLIKLNCAAIPLGLVESELFGHERGAFTGAVEKRVGRFSLADGGTIFLDEIGEIAPEVQVRLLRVLQEQEFEPVGSSVTQKVDVRVIAATNRDLRAAVADGAFRADLYYRLSIFPLEVPPLRERREDIPMLAWYFIERHAAKIGRRIAKVDEGTMERLSDYRWPGNIRELENVIERAVILTAGGTLQIDPRMLQPGAGVEPPPAGQPTLADAERRQITGALERCNWIIEGPRGAAKILGLHPNTLRSRLKRLGIRRGHEPA